MPRVIQIRDVPDDVHDALRAAAEARGLSLTRFMLGELEQLARRAQIAQENAAVVRRTRAAIGSGVDRDAILAAIHEGRSE
jgi:hypothetical protein